MSVSALSIRVRPRERPSLAPLGGALAASALGTLIAVAVHVLTWGGDPTLLAGLGVAGTLSAAALGLILFGLGAKNAGRVIAGAFAIAPAIAVQYLFLDRNALMDGLEALALAVVAGAGAWLSWRGERTQLQMNGWWLLGAGGVGLLWLIAATLRPAEVWVELPFRT